MSLTTCTNCDHAYDGLRKFWCGRDERKRVVTGFVANDSRPDWCPILRESAEAEKGWHCPKCGCSMSTRLPDGALCWRCAEKLAALRTKVFEAALAWHRTPLGWGGDDGMQRDALSVLDSACEEFITAEKEKP